MKYITLRTSETGKKFTEFLKKMKAGRDATIALGKELGFKEWRPGYWCVQTGISAIIFPADKEVNTKIWKNVNGIKNEWMPRLNTKEGKEIQAKIDALPVVHKEDLNDCIGWGCAWSTIGFNFTNKKYYGFEIMEKWNVKVPKDCKEVTSSEYNKIFEKNKTGALAE